MAGRDQAAKWAHPLGREIAIARGDPQTLSQRRSQVSAQAANTDKKHLRKGSHEIRRVQNRCTKRQPGKVIITGQRLRFCARLLAFG